MEKLEKMYSVKEITQLLSVHDRTVRMWVADGKVKSVKINGVLRIPESEVKRLIDGK